MRRLPPWALVLPLLALTLVGLAGCQGDPLARLREARDAVYEKRPEDALKQYRLALDLIERELKRTGSAEAQVLQARALKGAADVYYLELRDFRRAVESYQELIRVCPEAPETLEARIQLADVLHVHFGDPRGAIGALTSALERNPPESAELTYRVAKLYFELGDYQQVTLEAQRVRSRFETSSFVDDAGLLEAQALAMMEGRGQEAQRAFERLVVDFPDSPLVPHALYELGKLKAEVGEREQAIEHWVQALDRHPEPGLVQASITRVRRQIIERTPGGSGAGSHASGGLLLAPPRPSRPHRTSIEAAGGTAEEAALDVAD